MYIAMLDEVDEGTAMFKTAENSSMSPAQEYWLNLDADGYDLPSDWYLRSAGQAAEALRGNFSYSSSLGTPEKGIMTILPGRNNNCGMTFIFPDFDGESILEFSIDGGSTYPFSVQDDTESYTIGNVGAGSYGVFARHPGKEAVPMGMVKLSSCLTTSTESELIQGPGKVRIYPNPARSYIIIEGMEEPCQVGIFDVLGKRLKSLTIYGNKETIDLSGLHEGLYLVVLDDGVKIQYRKIQVFR
jgi:hypothetical protein